MNLIVTLIVLLVLLYFLLLGMDYAAAQHILPAVVEPVRTFLHMIFAPIVAFVQYVWAYFVH